MLLEYRGDVDDKLFKKFSDCKNFNSFINEFDCATNEEDKENIVKKSKDRVILLKERNRNSKYSEYISKLIGIVNAIDYFLNENSKK